MEEIREESYRSAGIKEIEQTASSQTKPEVVGGCVMDSKEIPEIKERNHNLSLASSNNEISLNGANDDITIPKKPENLEDSIKVNVANGNSTLSQTESSSNSVIEKMDALEFSLSEVNSGDFNIQSISGTQGEKSKLDNAIFTNSRATEKLLSEDAQVESEVKLCTEKSGIQILQNEDELKGLLVDIDSESMTSKNGIEEKNIDMGKDNKINDQTTDGESVLHEGVAETDVFNDNAEVENGSEENVKEDIAEDLIDEKNYGGYAETNSFERSEISISQKSENEGQILTIEALKAEEILKNGRPKGRELAPDGEDQMDGDQGSVEIDFMVGDDEQEEEHEAAEGNEIDSEEEEEKSELVEAGHDASAEFHLHQLSEKVGLQAIEEHIGEPIEFSVKETKDEIGSKFSRQVEHKVKDDNREIPWSDIHDKHLTGSYEEEKSEIYSRAAAASQLPTVSSEGQLSESAAAAVEERRMSLDSRPLIPREGASITENKVVETEEKTALGDDQWATNRFASVTDRRRSQTIISEVENKSKEITDKFTRKESIPEMLQYRKPTKADITTELNEKILEATKIELSEEQTEEGENIGDFGFKNETPAEDKTSTVEDSKSTHSETQQMIMKENQSKLNEIDVKARRSSSDLPVFNERPPELLGTIAKRGSVDKTFKTELANDPLLLLEERESKENEGKLNAKGKTPTDDEQLKIVASKQSLVQQESVKKMHLPVKSVTAATSTKKTTRQKILGKKEADNDSGVDETTQAKVETKKNVPTTLKGIPRKQQVITSPTKRLPSPAKALTSPVKQMASARTPLSPSGQKFNQKTPTSESKKLPMNKIVVGQAASPNLKEVKSKIGSMTNVAHRPGGGAIKLESKQLNFSQAKSKVGAMNATYKPSGGDKKIESKKLEWNARSKIGSLDNAKHKPGGGEKKIETVKLDFKDKATSKVGSTANIKHQPGGGKHQIEEHKLNFKDTAKSKVGSLDNVTHKPGGGSVVIYDDCRRQTSQSNSESQSPLQSLSPGPPQNGLTPTSVEGIPE